MCRFCSSKFWFQSLPDKEWYPQCNQQSSRSNWRRISDSDCNAAAEGLRVSVVSTSTWKTVHSPGFVRQQVRQCNSHSRCCAGSRSFHTVSSLLNSKCIVYMHTWIRDIVGSISSAFIFVFVCRTRVELHMHLNAYTTSVTLTISLMMSSSAFLERRPTHCRPTRRHTLWSSIYLNRYVGFWDEDSVKRPFAPSNLINY